MIQHLLLTLVQSRIILCMFVSDHIGSNAIMRMGQVSGSTWKRESASLKQMGIIECKEKVEFSGHRIKRKKCYALTQKGREIASHIHSISGLLEIQDPQLIRA